EIGQGGILDQGHSNEVQQPGRDHAAASPDLGDVGAVQVITVGFRKVLGGGVLEDIESFGIVLHQPVFDSVVDHLDEMPRAGRPAVQIPLFGGPADLLPSRGAGDVS